MVKQVDFINALDENRPAFGMDDRTLEKAVRGGFYNFGPSFS